MLFTGFHILVLVSENDQTTTSHAVVVSTSDSAYPPEEEEPSSGKWLEVPVDLLEAVSPHQAGGCGCEYIELGSGS